MTRSANSNSNPRNSSLRVQFSQISGMQVFRLVSQRLASRTVCHLRDVWFLLGGDLKFCP